MMGSSCSHWEPYQVAVEIDCPFLHTYFATAAPSGQGGIPYYHGYETGGNTARILYDGDGVCRLTKASSSNQDCIHTYVSTYVCTREYSKRRQHSPVPKPATLNKLP